MPQYAGKTTRRFGLDMLAVLVIGSGLAGAQAPARAAEGGFRGQDTTRLAQLPRYTASGTHQCGGNRTCIVTGQFNDCNDAMSSLRTRDCCATRNGGSSTGFALNYCIPESFRR